MLDSLSPFDPSDVISLYEFRLTLEPPAARLAAERITPHELRELREMVDLNRQSAETQQRSRRGSQMPLLKPCRSTWKGR